MPPIDIHAHISRRVAFRTIGCKLNQCETAQMQESFLAKGYRLVDWDADADVRVINTCTVTAKSDRTCRREIRSAKRLDPDCIVAVTGCYAEVAPETVKAIPGVDLVLGNAAKRHLTEQVSQALDPAIQSDTFQGPIPQTAADLHAAAGHHVGKPETPEMDDEFIAHFYGYTRAFLKIQTGCDSHCAYCIIPRARGGARSLPQERVLEQVRLLAARDYREIVLTGINLGSWGVDLKVERQSEHAGGSGRLAGLLRLLVERTSDVRFRLSSIEPLEMDAELVDTIAASGDRVAHHFHLPLQSGSEEVLRRMGRPYTADEYLRIARDVAARFPEAAIGADIIVGFPGETEDEFAETCDLVRQSPLTYLHVFSYSDRPETKASLMTDKIHPDVIHERSTRLRELGSDKTGAFWERITDTEQLVLVLRERAQEGHLLGLSGNYVEVHIDGDDDLMNTFVRGTLSGPPSGASSGESWRLLGMTTGVSL